MTKLMVFDRCEALRRLLRSETLLREVIGIFLRDLPRLKTQLKDAVDAKSVTSVCLAAHSLKGSASQVGGRVLTDRAWHVERLATDGNLPAALELMPSLWHDLDDLALVLEGELARGSA